MPVTAVIHSTLALEPFFWGGGGSGLLFSFVIFFTQTVSLLGRGICPSQGRYLKENSSVAIVRKRTIPTERPPLLGEISVNFGGQRNEFPRPLISVF
jgi:hypothetical protein